VLYMVVAVGLPVLVTIVLTAMAKQKKDYALVSLILKLIMVLGILSIPAFYSFHQIATK